MNKLLISPVFALFLISVKAQVTKGNWLVGGNAVFSTLKSASTSAVQFKQTNIQLSPVVGYFLKDKFAVGLKPSYTYGSNIVANTNSIIRIGPFARYYLLSTERTFNLISEVSHAYGSISGKGQTEGQRFNTFSLSAGPVIYFNSSVGLEFLIAYSNTKVVNFTGHNNELNFGIGFQFHLEKDN